MSFIVNYILARLSEASTWSAILAFLSAQMGLHLNPHLNGWVVQLGVCLAASAGILLKEGWRDGTTP